MKINASNEHVFGSWYFKIFIHEKISFSSPKDAGIIVTVVNLQELYTIHNKTDSLLSSIIKLCVKRSLTY